MILAELNRYYDRLIAEPNLDTGKAKVPVYGYSEEKIGSILILSGSGEIVDVVPNYEVKGKTIIQKTMFVPASFKRPGKYTEKTYKSGKDNAFFLWDKTSYSLGVDVDENRDGFVETEITYKSFKRFNLKILDGSSDQGVKSFVSFLQKWVPAEFSEKIKRLEILGQNIAFQLDSDQCYLHERPAIIKIWTDYIDSKSGDENDTCLVSGEQAKIARIHPSIKGVSGGQSSGGSIVSFNEESYESYGKSQGENAPVSELAAFKYTTALNYLLNRDNQHCFSVADASTVFWAVADNQAQVQTAEHLFSQIMNPPTGDDSETAQLRPVIDQIAKGRPLKEIAPDIDPNTRFYILGLAPNAARLSIRYWLDTSFGELERRIAEHYGDLALEPMPWKTPPSIWRLLIQLAPYREGQKTKSDEIPAHLAGELMRAVLTGNRYPRSILAQLQLRIRADGNISPLRVALMKAVLQRDFRKGLLTEDLPMSLDIENNNEAYLLGRLFAVIERIQSNAVKEANATVTDRYFGSASTVPYSVFPRLLAGSKNHLSKIRKQKPGVAVNLDKDMTEIIAKLPAYFSKHLSIEDQGRFTIGYYQQRERDFSSRRQDSSDMSEANQL